MKLGFHKRIPTFERHEVKLFLPAVVMNRANIPLSGLSEEHGRISGGYDGLKSGAILISADICILLADVRAPGIC